MIVQQLRTLANYMLGKPDCILLMRDVDFCVMGWLGSNNWLNKYCRFYRVFGADTSDISHTLLNFGVACNRLYRIEAHSPYYFLDNDYPPITTLDGASSVFYDGEYNDKPRLHYIARHFLRMADEIEAIYEDTAAAYELTLRRRQGELRRTTYIEGFIRRIKRTAPIRSFHLVESLEKVAA